MGWLLHLSIGLFLALPASGSYVAADRNSGSCLKSAKFSEESPGTMSTVPFYPIRGWECYSDNCDNMVLRWCTQKQAGAYNTRILEMQQIAWTSYFSDNSYKLCPSGQAVMSARCRGNDCDDISLLCGSPADSTWIVDSSYTWTSYFSEESPNIKDCAVNSVVRGVECQNNRCDNKRLACAIVRLQKILCPSTPPTLSHGYYQCNGEEEDSVCTAYCNEGYTRSQDASITCRAVANLRAEWQGSPVCTNNNECGRQCSVGEDPLTSNCHDCPPEAVCQDTDGGFDCNCQTGYSPSGDTCIDNNECVRQCEPGEDPALSTCHACVGVVACANSPGTHSCETRSPSLAMDGTAVTGHTTLTAAGILHVSTAIDSDTDYSNVVLRYGDVTCVPTSKNAKSTFTMQLDFDCTAVPGAGPATLFNPATNTLLWNFGLELTYPVPTIQTGSLQHGDDVTVVGTDPVHRSYLAGSSPYGVYLKFKGQNFGTDPTRVLVNFAFEDTVCAVEQVTETSILCILPVLSAYSLAMAFRVTAGGQTSGWSADTYRFPVAPHIEAIYGCTPGVTTKHVVDCPTKGGVALTLVGRHLCDADPCVTVSVGSRGQCTGVVEFNNASAGLDLTNLTAVTCVLGAGQGTDLSVVAAEGMGWSGRGIDLSYSAPSITQVSSSCPTGADGTIDCPRLGNVLVTLTGSNFGYDPPTVTIGCSQCSAVSVIARHETVVCTLPAGSGVEVAPILSQYLSQSSGVSSKTISYRQCAPGTRAEGFTCVDCTAGRYSETIEASACLPCPAGSVSSNNAAAVCIGCSAGYRASEATECLPCQKGWFSEARSLSCSMCGRGTFSAFPASPKCTACTLGKFQGDYNASSCDLCQPGTYTAREAQVSCQLCPPGTHTNASGQVVCTACLAGRFNDGQGVTNCQPCVPGKTSYDGANTCEQCRGLTIAPEAAATDCEQCPVTAIPNDISTRCLCPKGKRMLPSGVCGECPDGTTCQDLGTTGSNLKTTPGFWRINDQSEQWYQCLQREHCLGGLNSSCSPNSHGPLCNLCDAGTVRPVGLASEPCRKCPEQGLNLAIIIIAIALTCAALCGVWWWLLRQDQRMFAGWDRQEAKVQQAKSQLSSQVMASTSSLSDIDTSYLDDNSSGKLEDRSWRYESSTTAITAALQKTHRKEKDKATAKSMLRAIISFVQILTALNSLISVKWPTAFTAVLAYMDFVNLKILPWESIACAGNFDHFGRLFIFGLTPPLVFILLLLFMAPGFVSAARDMDDLQLRKHKLVLQRYQLGKLVVFFLYLILPKLAQLSLSTFACHQVEGVFYLRADFSIICFGDYWTSMMPLTITCLVVYLLALPTLMMVILHKARKRLKERLVYVALGFLYDGYNNSNYWFQLPDLLHKIVLVAGLQFLPSSAQAPVGMVAVTLYLQLIMIRDPFLDRRADQMTTLVQVSLYLYLLCGWFLYREFGLANAQLDPLVDDLLSIVLLALLLLVVTFFALRVSHRCYRCFNKFRRTRALRKAGIVE